MCGVVLLGEAVSCRLVSEILRHNKHFDSAGRAAAARDYGVAADALLGKTVGAFAKFVAGRILM